MHDSMRMRVGERPRNVAQHVYHLRNRQRAITRQPRAERFALHERHRVIRDAVDLPGGEHANDLRLLELGRELDLPVEPVGVDPRDQLRWKHFDYHLAPERTLLGDKDARHAAAAQFALERIGRAEGVLKLAALIHYGAA